MSSIHRHDSFRNAYNFFQCCFLSSMLVDLDYSSIYFKECPVYNKDLTLLRAKSIHPFLNWTQFYTKWHEVNFTFGDVWSKKTTWVISVRNLMLNWTKANLIWCLWWFRYDWKIENSLTNGNCKFLQRLTSSIRSSL